MRTLIHLSDLHFGRTDAALLQPLVSKVHELQPDLVVVSGDLTQRARTSQYRQAREFLARLPKPQLVVPGNHDVPLYRVLERFVIPFSNYRRYISRDLEPVFFDGEIAAIGINTAHSLTIQGGRMAAAQVTRAAERLRLMREAKIKVVVAHHPFELPDGIREKYLVKHAQSAMARLVACGVDLFLAGHLHLGHSELTTRRYRALSRSAIIVQVGTGLSTRRRGEQNSFNLIKTSAAEISVETLSWDGVQFRARQHERFARGNIGWDRLAA